MRAHLNIPQNVNKKVFKLLKSRYLMFTQVYYAPMYKLKLMNEYEFSKIFGCLAVLLALHQGKGKGCGRRTLIPFSISMHGNL